jgi:hypothetical protein
MAIAGSPTTTAAGAWAWAGARADTGGGPPTASGAVSSAHVRGLSAGMLRAPATRTELPLRPPAEIVFGR